MEDQKDFVAWRPDRVMIKKDSEWRAKDIQLKATEPLKKYQD